MITLLLSLLLSLAYCQVSLGVEFEEIADVRCVHGGHQVPIIVPVLSSCITTTCSFATTSTLMIPNPSINSAQTVPGPSAMYTSLTISGTLTANQVCTSNVAAANMNSLFLSSGYYSRMSDYQVLRSNASIFGTFGNELVITATDGIVGDFFGRSVDMSGDGSTIVAGAPGNLPTSQGTVYIYRRQLNTWVLLQEIHDPTGTNFDVFGSFVAISTDASTIAASGSGGGALYLYQYNATLDQYVLAQSISGSGRTVALSATGQYLVSTSFATQSQAFVYVRNDTCSARGSVWILQQALTPTSSPSTNLQLRAAVSADSSTIAVGVLDGTLSIPDSVQMFTRSGTQWSLVQTLTASDGIADDSFGTAVALSGNGQYLLVGAASNSTGRVYEFVYRGGTTLWNQENEFFPPAGVTSFGVSVDISADGTVGVIGATAVSDPGNVFVARRSPDNNWTVPARFTGHSASAELGLSTAVSPDGAFMVAGAPDLLSGTFGSISIFRPVGALIPADTIITGSLCVNVNMIVDADLLVTGSVFIQGSIITGGTVPCLTPSDRRLKRDIEPLPAQEAFEKLQLLRPVTFSWVNPEEHPDESNPSAGLIAQDVERYFPHWIHRDRARGKDAQLVSAEDPARLIEITPELYAYLVACIKGLEESDTYKDKLMTMYKARCKA